MRKAVKYLIFALSILSAFTSVCADKPLSNAAFSKTLAYDIATKENASVPYTNLMDLFSYPGKESQFYIHFSRAISPSNYSIQKSNDGRTLKIIFRGVKYLKQPNLEGISSDIVENVKIEEFSKNNGFQLIITAKKPVTFQENFKSRFGVISIKPKGESFNSVDRWKLANDIKAYPLGDDGSEVIISTDLPDIKYTEKKEKDVTLITLSKVKLINKNVEVLKIDPKSVAKSIIAQNVPNGLQISIKSNQDFETKINQLSNRFSIEIKRKIDAQLLAEQTGRKTDFTGKPMSLNFQNISVRSLLQLMAEFTEQNFIISDSVTGSMALHVKDLPWDQVFNIILKTQGLAARKIGNVTMIAPRTEIMQRELLDLQANQQTEELAPLYPEIIHLHYAKATNLAAVIKDVSKSLLSPRGQVSVDKRTNSLWIKDTSKNINEIQRLVKRLDVPVRQVMIEARIVNVNRNFTKELGVRIGLTSGRHLAGTLEGANELYLAGGNASSVSLLNTDKAPNRLNFSLPASAIGTSNPASIGLALFKITGNTHLDLELSALENEGHLQVISSPHIVTANQNEAMIETGEEIPYKEDTSSGATATEFKKAVLALKITPQITPDKKIILDLRVNQDTRADSSLDVQGEPAIDTQMIQTQVLLNNGETIVLGGAYKKTKQNVVTRVPFLGTLPIIGALFRHNQKIDQHSELLIFITPRVLS